MAPTEGSRQIEPFGLAGTRVRRDLPAVLTCSGSTRVDRVRIHRDPRVSCGVLPAGVGHVSAARMPPVTHSGAAVRRPGGGGLTNPSGPPLRVMPRSCSGRNGPLSRWARAHRMQVRAARATVSRARGVEPMADVPEGVVHWCTPHRHTYGSCRAWLSHVCRSAFDAEIVRPDLHLILCVQRCAVVLGFRG